jgi:predicted transcriptional regulator
MFRSARLLRQVWVVAAVAAPAAAQTQTSDPDFDASVERPAYPSDGPVVVVDEAHANFHTTTGRYRPFAELLRNDGYTVVAGRATFSRDALSGVTVLVIANARPPSGAAPGAAAFTEPESDAVRDWVRDGGALLLIADHAPFGSAAESLGRRFGVTMGKGWVWDFRDAGASIATRFVTSRENGLLGSHAVLRGRDASEEVTALKAFSGQSLNIPRGASVLMKLGATAREARNRADLATIREAVRAAAAGRSAAADDVIEELSQPVGERAQGIAFTFGEGRVVVLGEAAMLSAQVTTTTNPPRTTRAGMNVPGYDNRQFVLNLLHWLSGLLP